MAGQKGAFELSRASGWIQEAFSGREEGKQEFRAKRMGAWTRLGRGDGWGQDEGVTTELDGVGCARVRTHPGLEVETPGPEHPDGGGDGGQTPRGAGAQLGGVSTGRPGTFPWGVQSTLSPGRS